MVEEMTEADVELLRLQPAMCDALNAVLCALRIDLSGAEDFHWTANPEGTAVTVTVESRDGRTAEATMPVVEVAQPVLH